MNRAARKREETLEKLFLFFVPCFKRGDGGSRTQGGVGQAKLSKKKAVSPPSFASQSMPTSLLLWWCDANECRECEILNSLQMGG